MRIAPPPARPTPPRSPSSGPRCGYTAPPRSPTRGERRSPARRRACASAASVSVSPRPCWPPGRSTVGSAERTSHPTSQAASTRGSWHEPRGQHAGGCPRCGYIVDRLKDVIVTDGFNVYSTEVENALAGHPAVAACAVIAVPDDALGERVHAVIVPEPRGGDRPRRPPAPLPRVDRRLRGTAQLRVRRLPAPVAHREAAQARAAQAALGGNGPPGALTCSRHGSRRAAPQAVPQPPLRPPGPAAAPWRGTRSTQR
jgi:AMP-binding enzyme C-terminal domain